MDPAGRQPEQPVHHGQQRHVQGTAWTEDFSSGEMIRAGYDQTFTISPCNIQYLYHGDAPGSYSSYNAIPWRLGLVTQTNSTC
ncbi:MAG TPA: non-reducing end alpha-L-arabinofuranosidase family hydrolase [Streptosporangiaceae bacterium]|nr:non-reducing end alpha-L-arabinofuranosidase family hydrolase [Streptosporangiaceae bacterium]